MQVPSVGELNAPTLMQTRSRMVRPIPNCHGLLPIGPNAKVARGRCMIERMKTRPVSRTGLRSSPELRSLPGPGVDRRTVTPAPAWSAAIEGVAIARRYGSEPKAQTDETHVCRIGIIRVTPSATPTPSAAPAPTASDEAPAAPAADEPSTAPSATAPAAEAANAREPGAAETAGSGKATMESTAMKTTAMEAATTAESHRAGAGASGKRKRRRPDQYLFPHQNLLCILGVVDELTVATPNRC